MVLLLPFLFFSIQFFLPFGFCHFESLSFISTLCYSLCSLMLSVMLILFVCIFVYSTTSSYYLDHLQWFQLSTHLFFPTLHIIFSLFHLIIQHSFNFYTLELFFKKHLTLYPTFFYFIFLFNFIFLFL